jgi:hypothetical protein
MRFAAVLVCLLPIFALAQQTISGRVTDQQGEGLPFVHILVNNAKSEVFTADAEGRFAIPRHDSIRILSFSYVGFRSSTVELNSQPVFPLRVMMTPESYNLSEAVVVAGDNPAHRIIALALANRDRHNPANRKGYQYQAYSRLRINMKPADKEDQQVFIMETVSEHAFERPNQRRERIIRHRTAGFKQAWLAGLTTQLQPFSFYDDEILFLEKRYLNPISPGSTRRYRFVLEDVLSLQGDSLFVISFQPRAGMAFTGLKGALYIHSDGFALQQVIAGSAEAEKIHFHIDQQFQRTAGGQWFPEQLQLVMRADKYPSPELGMRIQARTWIDSVRINPTFPDRFFSWRNNLDTLPEVSALDDLLPAARREALSTSDVSTYALLDSIGQAAGFDAITGILGSGTLNIGPLQWLYTDLIRFSEYEGFTPGLGLRVGKEIQLYGYLGYASRAKRWKQTVRLNFFPDKTDRTTELGMQFTRDLTEPAILAFPQQNLLVNRRYFAQRMDRDTWLGVYFAARLSPALQVRASARRQNIEPLYPYVFIPRQGEPFSAAYFTEGALFWRYAPGIKTMRLLGVATEINTGKPVFLGQLTRGWSLATDYWRAEGRFQYTRQHRSWGDTRISAEAGWSSRELPYVKLFTPVGTGSGFNAISLQDAFETMQPYEFVHRQFVQVYLEHAFKRLTRNHPNFQPAPALIHRMGLGRAPEADRHEGIPVKGMERGYFESGLALYNLLRINYVHVGWLGLGLKVLYRYGPYQLPTWQENTAIRLTLTLSR